MVQAAASVDGEVTKTYRLYVQCVGDLSVFRDGRK